jgi:hypothetical protein
VKRPGQPFPGFCLRAKETAASRGRPCRALAAVVWLAASALFSWYAANFGKFNETYGSAGAVTGFMTWLWISAIVILVGAEIDAEMEHQTARDTTTGAIKPMGGRGARMADTLGPAQTAWRKTVQNVRNSHQRSNLINYRWRRNELNRSRLG